MESIISAGLTDIPVIRNIAEITWPFSYADMISTEQIRYMLDWMYSDSTLALQLEEGQQFILYEENNEYKGFAGFGPKAGDAAVWRLEKLYVLPNQQNKGIGKLLLKEVMERTKQSGAKLLELNVNRNNKALQFYQHLGFEIVETVDLDIGGGFFMNDYILQKDVSTI